MKQKRVQTYLFWILFTEAVGALSGWLTRDGMEFYKAQMVKPPLSPPAIVFPIVWAILYALMGIGMARVYLSAKSEERTDAIQVYLLQLAINFTWSIFFFNLRTYGGALAVLLILLALIVWMILRFRRVDRPAARLQIPYVLWVSFAAYLNAGVWILNR
ncbi:MAG: tryptophan-rich sensory protein [Oscillospiraceae bacterium]|nr:tryptophan-rich sensory protein [Oscillospiraceae bacterium]